jgi:hypothetical protein
MPHTIEKLLMRATTFLETSFQSEVCTQSYRAPKLRESQLWENVIWMWGSWRDTEYILKGQGGGFPQVWVVMSLVSPSLPMVCPSTESVQTMH